MAVLSSIVFQYGDVDNRIRILAGLTLRVADWYA